MPYRLCCDGLTKIQGMVTEATDKVSGLSLLLGHTHTHTHTHTRTHTHTCILGHTHMNIHAYMLKHTPTHKCMHIMQAHTCTLITFILKNRNVFRH